MNEEDEFRFEEIWELEIDCVWVDGGKK